MPSKSERLLQRLEWTILKRLDGLLQGDYRTFFQGFGMDLADLREYQYGDDVRTIDWNLTARMSEPYVRRHYEDRELQVWFVVDTSASVDFGTVDRLKRDLANEVVGLLARVSTRQGHRVGACLSGATRPVVVPAKTGRGQALAIMETMADPAHRPKGETNLQNLFDTAAGLIHGRALVIVVSDFIGPGGWERTLGAMGARHELIAVPISDPRETELPDIGAIWFQDAETGEQIFVDTGDRRFRERFADFSQRRIAALRQTFKQAGVDPLWLSTEGDTAADIVKFVARRKRRRAAASVNYRTAKR